MWPAHCDHQFHIVGSILMLINQEEIIQSLADTIAWCTKRFTMFDLSGSLRSWELRPASIDREGTPWDNAAQLVDEVIENRRKALPNMRYFPQDHLGSWWSYDESPNFLLLCYFHDWSVADGFSPPRTGGFLNDDDCPPWDTWIWHHDEYIIGLVPEELKSGVQLAIETNSTDCIQWLENLRDPFATSLIKVVRQVYPWSVSALHMNCPCCHTDLHMRRNTSCQDLVLACERGHVFLIKLKQEARHLILDQLPSDVGSNKVGDKFPIPDDEIF